MNLPMHKKMLSAAAAASVLLLTAACGSSEEAEAGTSAPASSEAAPTTDAPGEDAPADDTATGAYTDGDYEASGSYSRPSGSSDIDVSLTLEGDVVTAVEVTPQASGTSLQFQEKFVSGIADEVVGKSLDDIDVSKVSGSSLTSKGFNAALEEIKSEAQA